MQIRNFINEYRSSIFAAIITPLVTVALIIISATVWSFILNDFDKSAALDQEITELQAELERKEASIVELQNELNKFIHPIEYDVTPAPLYDLPLSDELQQYTYDTCRYYEIEEHYEVVLAVMWRESTYRQDLVSDTDDHGIMQINKCNHEDLYELLDIVDIMEPRDNIECGVYILSTLIRQYDGNLHKALMTYNMGPRGAAEQWERGNYTSYYSRDVLEKAEQIMNDNYRTN